MKRAAVLLYHRVADVRHDPFELCVKPELFSRHVRYLASHCQVLPLHELVACLTSDALPDRSVGVTFDDGYLDNLTTAAPLLDDLNVPATFFLTGARGGSGLCYWWDLLTSSLLEAESIPARIALTDPAGVEIVVDGTGDRLRVLRTLHARLRVLGVVDRERTLHAIIRQCGTPTLADSDRPMRPDEVATLCRNPRHQIGAHTSNHLSLPVHSEVVQEGELSEARAVLRDITGSAVDCLAYPFGDNDARTRRLADRAGFVLGFTTERRALSIADELLCLPRIEINATFELEAVLASAFAAG